MYFLDNSAYFSCELSPNTIGKKSHVEKILNSEFEFYYDIYLF